MNSPAAMPENVVRFPAPIPKRFNLWCVTKGFASVVAYEQDRASLLKLMPLGWHPMSVDEDGLRFVILPDGQEPDLV